MVAQGRLAAEDDQPLLLDVVPVVRKRPLPRRELVQAGVDLLGPEPLADAEALPCPPRPVAPAVPVIAEQIDADLPPRSIAFVLGETPREPSTAAYAAAATPGVRHRSAAPTKST
jgi:hypothetical protein